MPWPCNLSVWLRPRCFSIHERRHLKRKQDDYLKFNRPKLWTSHRTFTESFGITFNMKDAAQRCGTILNQRGWFKSTGHAGAWLCGDACEAAKLMRRESSPRKNSYHCETVGNIGEALRERNHSRHFLSLSSLYKLRTSRVSKYRKLLGSLLASFYMPFDVLYIF